MIVERKSEKTDLFLKNSPFFWCPGCILQAGPQGQKHPSYPKEMRSPGEGSGTGCPVYPGAEEAAWICSLGSGFLSPCTQSWNTAGLSSLSIASWPWHLENANAAMCLFGTDLQAVSWSVPEVNFQELISYYSQQYLCCGVASVFSNHFDTLDKRISIIINQIQWISLGTALIQACSLFSACSAHWLQLYNTGTEHRSSAQENSKTVSNNINNCLFCMADQ